MSYWRDIWRIIESDGTSTKRDSAGNRVISNATSFRGMSMRRQQRVIDTMANEMQQQMMNANDGHIVTLSDIRKQAASLNEPLLSLGKNGEGSIARIRDTIGNYPSNANMQGQDPNLANFMTPNIWIDAAEAAGIFGQGGIPAFIINKKSKPIVTNGVTIKNSKLSREQMGTVNECAACKTGFAKAASDGARDGLTYGGALMFPFFKHDNPITMGMSVSQLMKMGIIEKGCISRYTVLDKWNTVHIPNWNPTAADFLEPLFYYIPYLGADVAGQRCARIVPLPQPGYWGMIMTMGWGASDIPGWYQAVCNYEQVASSIPSMIRQMSIIVRTFNVDLANALNGATTLKDLDRDATIAMREASSNNIISMDVIGELKAIQRDFNEVPALTRLVRQDVAARANIPEEKFWSSERGAFASGDLTEGLNEGEWGGVKYVHSEVEQKLKKVAMIEIINALGKDRDIIAALPYTTVEIGEPRIERAETRAKVFKDLSEGAFNMVASGAPIDIAVALSTQYGDKHLIPSAEIMQALKDRQAEVDRKNDEEHEASMKMQAQQLKNAEAGIAAPGGATGSAKPAGKKSEGYTPLEQKMSERTRGANARHESLGKAEGKKL